VRAGTLRATLRLVFVYALGPFCLRTTPWRLATHRCAPHLPRPSDGGRTRMAIWAFRLPSGLWWRGLFDLPGGQNLHLPFYFPYLLRTAHAISLDKAAHHTTNITTHACARPQAGRAAPLFFPGFTTHQANKQDVLRGLLTYHHTNVPPFTTHLHAGWGGAFLHASYTTLPFTCTRLPPLHIPFPTPGIYCNNGFCHRTATAHARCTLPRTHTPHRTATLPRYRAPHYHPALRRLSSLL